MEKTKFNEVVMKKIKINTGERLLVIQLLNSFKGGFVEQAVLAEDAKKFFMDEVDWKAVKRTIEDAPTEKDPQGKRWRWDNTIEKDFEISFTTAAFLLGKLQKMDEEKSVGIGDVAVVSLYGKLK